MNIGKRINARKIMLSYIYQHCFFCNILNQESVFTDILFIDNVFLSQKDKFLQEKESLVQSIKLHINQKEKEENIKEFSDIFFNEWNDDDVDFDYAIKILLNFKKHEKDLIKNVDLYAQNFKYDQMDTIDQSIFLLGYTEWKVLETQKEILLNEMIELSKRYSDD
jgi:transcription termination factor NusB